MIAYLSFEWLQLRIRWMPRVVLLLLMGTLVFGFFAQGSTPSTQANLFFPRAWLAALIFASFFAPFFWPVLGGSWAGNEYSWGTIRLALTRRPDRIRYVLATLAVLLIGAGMALVAALLVGSIAGVAVGSLTGHSPLSGSIVDVAFLVTVGKSFLAAWYVAAFYVVLSYAAGTLFRSAAAGIGVGIGTTLAQIILSSIFLHLGGVWRAAAQHFPLTYTSDLPNRVAAAGFIRGSSLGTADPTGPNAVESLMALGLFMAILIVATAVTVRSRDVTA